jgi:hypothetical protein
MRGLAGFLEEPLEVVHRRPHLTIVAVRGSRDASHNGATYLPVVVIVMFGHSRGPLRALFAPPFAPLDASLSQFLKEYC